MIGSWNSPYQNSAYIEGLQAANIPVDIVKTPDGTIYFSDGPETPTAWELDIRFSPTTLHMAGRLAYQMCAAPSEPLRAKSYYTLALTPEDTTIANRFMRNVKKANAVMPQAHLEIAETKSQLTTVIGAFEPHRERRDDIPMNDFAQRITALHKAGALLAYALMNGTDNLGVACVLTSQSQANLRYYTSERANYAGHLLHHYLIEDLFSVKGFDVVDLSGVSPSTTDRKLQGIDEFKKQLGGTVVEFKRV